MIKKSLLFLLISIGISLTGISQEQLRSALSNPSQKGIEKHFKSGIIVLELPFVDDFSAQSPYPDQSKWTDSYAFINNNYGINSPGAGVATLDALDSVGAIYQNASFNSFQADQLTSKPINMDIGGDTTAYLSFFYQAQGLGDSPEAQDSLVLEFYAPNNDKWHWIWSTEGTKSTEFNQVMIPVRGAIFLQNGFQFRFRNYASLANAYEPSLITNADHWHLDYIYLNINRHYQDTIVNDLCLQQGTGSLLLNYTALPWEHFRLAGINEVKTIFPVHLNNLSATRKFYEPIFKITDDYGSTQGFEKVLLADEVQAFQELKYDATFNYSFSSDATDSARFTIELDLQPTESDLIPENSKISFTQEFSNYYSYDDGTAEAGYGLTGEGSIEGMIAVKFKNFNPGDSLLGLSIFFNRSIEDSNIKYFRLAVWNEVEGKPGDLIHIQEGAKASLEKGLNGYDFFSFDTAQIVPEIFYVGVQQLTGDFLNIGFDKNTESHEKIFYLLSQSWKNTSFVGSLMLRPVFGNKSKKSGTGNDFNFDTLSDLNIYPNPAISTINLDYPPELSDAILTILNLSGQEVKEKVIISHQVDLSGLPHGTYFIVAQNAKQRIIRKIIKLYD